jgi:hypothetical protein
MANGFQYSYILNADATWSDLRKTTKWIALMKKFPAKIYFEPQLIQLGSSN